MNARTRIDAPDGRPVERWPLLLAVMLCGSPLMALIFTVLGPVLPAVAAHFGGERLTAQMIMTMPSLGIMIGGPITGWLVERHGVRRIILWVLAIYAAAGCAGFVLDDRWTMLASRFLLGAASAGVIACTMSLIGEYFEPEARGRILGYQGAIAAAVGFCGVLAGGVLGEANGWRAPFLLYGSALVVMVMSLIAVPDRPHERAAAGPGGVARLLRLWPTFLLLVFFYGAAFTTNVQVPFKMAEKGITSPDVLAWVISPASVTTAIGSASYGWLRGAIGERGVFVAFPLLMAIGFATVGLADSPLPTGIGCAVAGFGGGLVGPHLIGRLLTQAAPEIRGRAVGFAYTAIFTGDFLNPIAFAPVATHVGIDGAFLFVAAALVVGAVGVRFIDARVAST